MVARVKKKYETDDGEVRRIRLSTTIAALAGTEASGSITSQDFVAARGSRRKSIGKRARGYTYTRNRGTETAPSIQTIFVPYLTPTAFDSAPDTVTYGGQTFDKGSKVPED